MTTQKKVHFDNPVEREKQPKEGLSFEFVAEVNEGDIYQRLWAICFLLIVSTFALRFFAAVIRFHFIPDWLPLSLVACVLGVAIGFFWTLQRDQFKKKASPYLGLALGAGLLVTSVLSKSFSQIYVLPTAILLLYASTEFAIHWSVIKQRGLNPFLAEEPSDSSDAKSSLGYDELIITLVIVAIVIVTSSLFSFGVFLLPLAAIIVWGIAFEKSNARKLSPWKLLRFAVERFCLYPDSKETPPGVLKSPILPQSLRSVPFALFLSHCAIVMYWTGDYITPVTSLVLLFGTWVIIASEFCYEF